MQYLTDTIIRVTRVIRAPIDKVWAAHNDPEVVCQWMLGPAGWVMTSCDIAQQVGESYRYEWEAVEGTDRFGFTGELLAFDAPYHFITTERMLGIEGASTTNEVNFAEVSQGTLVTTVMEYPTTQL